MTLDPLSAFSVACNVLQIVETSLRVLGRSAECYKSGSLDEVSIIVGNVHTIEGLNNELRGILPDPLGRDPLSSAELRLVDANEQCLRLSGDFMKLLDGLKITKKSVWRSIGISVKSMWYQDKLKSFEKAISEARANLTLAFLLLMHERSLMMHRSAVNSTTNVEHSILDILKKKTSSLEAEIRELTASLKDMSFEQHRSRTDEFCFIHQTELVRLSEQLAQIWKYQRAADEARKTVETSRIRVAAQHNLIQSLQFPQMQERKEEISSAYKDTYEWLFQAAPREQEDWHSFVSWARRADSPHKIYWIQGKPGSGKSTLARFVNDRLDVHEHLQPWAGSRAVIKAAHFFWSPGTTLQKSWIGMLRCLFSQLLDQVPELSEPCVSASRWRATASSDAILAEWTASELLYGIYTYVRITKAYLFFLIDGLDELQGDDARREELIDFLLDLASHNNVKLCISSRPDNIFRDAFQNNPSLKLEKLTYIDIEIYVNERFAKERRVQTLGRGNPDTMKALVEFLVNTASGVFLWVRLVVYDLLRAARDGATFAELVDMAHQLPRDLDSYFTRFIDSIPPEYRQEASYLFQITLHEEDLFGSMHGLRLLDLSFLGKLQGAKQSQAEYDAIEFDPENISELNFTLDTAARRINSRCRGLIECYYVAGNTQLLLGDLVSSELSNISNGTPPASSSRERSTLRLLETCNHHVGLVHRSLRDFLVSPKAVQQLQTYSTGHFNTRMFLCKARLAQIRSLDYEGNHVHAQLALGLSSYVLSALSTDEMKHLDESAFIASQIRPIVESLGRTRAHLSGHGAWYLCKSLHGYQTEDPDFLLVAIDFDLVAYLRKELTPIALKAERKMPILECILIGRFAYALRGLAIGNRFPNIEVLRLALELGADPNESVGGCSVWGRFIRHLVDFGKSWTLLVDAQKAHVEAIRALLEYGADPELPSSWLKGLDSDLMPVSTILRRMLGSYTHARKELQECIGLANEKFIQAQAHR